MRIFVLEDDPIRIRWFRERFIKHETTFVTSCDAVDSYEPPYDLILLNHDLGGRQMLEHEDCGLTFVKLIKSKLLGTDLVIVHSYNRPGAKRMLDEIDKSVHFCDHMPYRGPAFNTAVKMFERMALLKERIEEPTHANNRNNRESET